MGLVPGQSHLTAINPELEAARKQTFPGMAHFAATGPNDKTCRECLFWGPPEGFSPSGGQNRGLIKPRQCKKRAALMGGKVGNKVPDHARACKYFEQEQNPPSRYWK